MTLPDHPLLSEEFRVVAYRGGASERPENTLEAFEHAAALSPSLVMEMDIRRTADGVLVAAHDADVMRTTGAVGSVSALKYAALRELDAGFAFERAGQFPYRGKSLRVPRVEEVLASFPRHCFVLDVHDRHPSIASDIASLVQQQGAASRVVIASEISSVIQAIRRQHPDWLFGGTAGQLLARVLLSRVRLDVWAPRTGGVLMIPETHHSLNVLSLRLVEQAHRRGERVWVWVVERTHDLRRLRALGVDGVFTGQPSAFTSACSELEVSPR